MLKDRISYLRSAINRPIPAAIIGVASFVGICETLSDHLIPPEVFKFPKLWEVVKYISNTMPDITPIGWLAFLILLLALITFEYSYHIGANKKITPSKPVNSTTPLAKKDKANINVEAIRKYATPSDAKDIDLKKSTNSDLGKLIEATGRDVLKFRRGVSYNTSHADMVSDFQKKLGGYILWTYEEAMARGHKDTNLQAYFNSPHSAISSRDDVEWIGNAMIKLGSAIALVAD